MAWRITEDDVRGIVQVSTSISLGPFIDTANTVTDHVDSKDTAGDLSDAMLREIEKNLAAHYYSLRDQLYSSKSTGKASGSFQGQTGMGFDFTPYGQTAKRLDFTGTLASMDRTKHRVSATWLGKPKSDQTLYEDRD